MKSKRTILFQFFMPVCLGIFMLQLSSCQKDEPGGGGGGTEALTFPSKVGNSWKYYTLSERFDTTGKLTHKEQYHHYWSVEKDTMVLGEKAFKMKCIDSSFNNTILTRYAYYVQKGSGLYLVAVSQGGGSFFYLKRADNESLFMFPSSSGFGKKGDLFFPDTALYILKYPVKMNAAWSSNEFGKGYGWRKFVGKESVNTQAGMFLCYKIKFWMEKLSSLDERDIFYYYGAKGLIQYTENMELNSTIERSTLIRKTQLISTNF